MKKAIVFVFAIFAALLLQGCRDAPPPNVVNSAEDAQGRIIGALSGSPSAWVAADVGRAQLFSSTDDLMYHLRAGTIDCVIMDSTVASELVADTTGVRVLGEPLLVYDLRFAIPRENSQLLQAVDAALAELRSNGTLGGLRNKYFAGRRYAYEAPEGVEQRQATLTLAVASDSPPFSYKDVNGEYAGLDIEVAQAVCDYLGVEMKIIEYDVAELITAVRFGRADLALGWVPGEEDEIINISEPYAVATHVIVVRR